MPSELENSRPVRGGSGAALAAPGCEFVSSWYDEEALAPAGLGNMSVPATPTAALEPLDTALYAAAVEVTLTLTLTLALALALALALPLTLTLARALTLTLARALPLPLTLTLDSCPYP